MTPVREPDHDWWLGVNKLTLHGTTHCRRMGVRSALIICARRWACNRQVMLVPDLPFRFPPNRSAGRIVTAFLITVTAVLGCGKDSPVLPPGSVVLSQITVVGAPATLERGTLDSLTATVLDEDGDTVDVPVVWRSGNERVATFRRGGVVFARDTGQTTIRASALGVLSDPITLTVVWLGPAHIDSAAWTVPNARGPAVALTDSIRVRVINVDSAPVANARVKFTVTVGGGSVSPAIATTNQFGIAATRWTLGPAAGSNMLTASVVRSDDSPDTLVVDNLVTFTINSYNALTAQSGNNQTALLLSELPDVPTVRLVDSLGNPRAGVPVTFTAFANGRVATPVVSTGADGVASPGKWTLGDIPGSQQLDARVEDAIVSFTATATGTPIHYKPVFVTAGGFTTCALEANGIVKCWGAELQIGTGDTTNIVTPTAVKGTLVASSVTTGVSHSCALTSQGFAWCWGLNAFVDTAAGASPDAAEPKQLQSDIAWAQISPGFAHNCGITLLGAAYCWGRNSVVSPSADHRGQLGDGTTTDRRVATPVAGGFSFSRIASGTNHTCALTNGSALCWGQNQAGQLGDGTTQMRLNPTTVSGGVTFESIGAGQLISCGLTALPAGKVYCWGSISGTPQPTPSTYASAPAFASLSVGGGHACALTSDALAYCWGANDFGQLGDSTTTRRNTPTRVAGDLRFTQISAGFTHTCGITTAGAVACWGRNGAGELGDSTVTQRIKPRHIVLGVTP
jgi:alpha-tubulin suppressor-like RCC1 family protein